MNTHKMHLLGTAIRGFRLRAGLSLAELALAMGWQGNSPVMAIEKGRRLPRPETLERLGECLGLRHAEIVYLQGLGGYRQPTVLPPFNHIRTILNDIRVSHSSDHMKFPIYLIDYQFRLWMANGAASIYVEQGGIRLQEWVDRQQTILELIFDRRLNIASAAIDQDETNRDQVYRFKSRNLFRQHEDFYISYPECLKSKLTASDYVIFKANWDAVQNDSIGQYRVKTLNKTIVNGITMDFILEEHPIPQLEDLFFLVTYYPDPTPSNLQRCQQFFGDLQDVFTNQWFISEVLKEGTALSKYRR